MPSSRASAPMRSVVGPGTGSAHSKYSGFVSTQKYIVLNSSGRQAIFAPRAAAWRTIRSAISMLTAFSACPMNCTPAIRTMTCPPELAKRWNDPLREVAEQAKLVIEVNAHPELPRPRRDRPLELLDAVGRGPHDGET